MDQWTRPVENKRRRHLYRFDLSPHELHDEEKFQSVVHSLESTYTEKRASLRQQAVEYEQELDEALAKIRRTIEETCARIRQVLQSNYAWIESMDQLLAEDLQQLHNLRSSMTSKYTELDAQCAGYHLQYIPPSVGHSECRTTCPPTNRRRLSVEN